MEKGKHNVLVIRVLLVVALCSGTAQHTFAQNLTKCELALEKATRYFEQGNIERVPSILKNCTESDELGYQNQLKAYELLAETYLYLNYNEEADIILKRLLKLNPAFGLNTTSISPEMAERIRTFRTAPILGIGGNFGLVGTMSNTIASYNTDISDENNNPPKTTPALGFRVGGDVDVRLGKHFEFVTGLDLVSSRFKYQDSLVNFIPVEDIPSTYDRLKFNELHFSLDVPILLRYRVAFKQFEPYAYLGVHTNFLMKAALKKIERSSGAESAFDQNITIFRPFAFQKNKPKEEQLRVFKNLSFTGGFGAKIPLKLDFLMVDFQYNWQLNNAVRRVNRYQNPKLLYKFAYVDDDFRLSTFSLTIGFSKSIYKPKKKKGEPAISKSTSEGFWNKIPVINMEEKTGKLKEDLKSKLPETPKIEVPEIKLPESPEIKTPEVPKMEIPIRNIELPQRELEEEGNG